MASNNRIWTIGGVLVIIVVLALGGLLGVKPQLDAAASSDDQRASTEALNAQHKRTLASLEEQFAQVDAIRGQVAEVRNSIPGTADLDGVIGDLAAFQAASGVSITSYSSGDPTPFMASEEIAADVPGSVSASNFLTIEINLVISGTRPAMMTFVNAMQTSNRMMLVKSLNVSDDDETVISALVYVLLDTPIGAAAEAAVPPVEATASE